VIHLPTGLKADFYPSPKHSYWALAWKNRKLEQVEGAPVYFAPAEYVILWKLQFFQEGGGEKHLRDVRGMLGVSGDVVDRVLIENAVAELRLMAEWRQAMEP
jgi:hypothetical protein